MSESAPAPAPSAAARRLAKLVYCLLAPFVFYVLFYVLSLGVLLVDLLPLPSPVQAALSILIIGLSVFGAGAFVWLGWRSLCSKFEKRAA